MNEILKVEHIEKYYGNKGSLTKALSDLSFVIEKGEYVGIMGASGSGKTTLLNCISTIDKVTSGSIKVGGAEITRLKGNRLNRFRREELGFIFQDFNLLDTLSIEENIALPLAVRDVPAKEIKDTVRSLMRRLGIGDIAAKFPAQVSGGQKQRCACARAFVNKPRLVLADEPTGALNKANTEEVLDLLTALYARGQSILLVTHDREAALRGNRILYLEDGSIVGELELSPYQGKDREREQKLAAWLEGFQW